MTVTETPQIERATANDIDLLAVFRADVGQQAFAALDQTISFTALPTIVSELGGLENSPGW